MVSESLGEVDERRTIMTRAPLLLGLDAGGSGTKWSLVRDGRVVASGVAEPLTTALLGSPEGLARLSALAAALPGQADAVHAGIPGLTAHSSQAAAVQQLLADALGLDGGRISVEGDLDLAYRAHLSPGAGVLLYAGTGSIAYHVAANGQVVRAGGRGYRIGDDGGGYSIGRAAARWFTDALDLGDSPDSVLSREMAAITGGADWEHLRDHVYGMSGAAPLAALAPAVGRAADANDPDAIKLIEQAAAALAELARRVQARVGHLPVTATGGALRITPQFAAALGRALPGSTMQQRDHAEAAARYAATRVGH